MTEDASMSLDGAVKTFSGFCVAKDDPRRWRREERDEPAAGALGEVGDRAYRWSSRL
jgi:hypothetical protein